jgi:hypothetical protein
VEFRRNPSALRARHDRNPNGFEAESDPGCAAAPRPTWILTHPVELEPALDLRLGLVVFRVVDDDHALAPIPLDTSQQGLPDQLPDGLIDGKLVDRRQRTEPVEHVIARAKQHESPDAERGGTGEKHAESGTFPTELRRKSERDRARAVGLMAGDVRSEPVSEETRDRAVHLDGFVVHLAFRLVDLEDRRAMPRESRFVSTERVILFASSDDRLEDSDDRPSFFGSSSKAGAADQAA